MPSLLPAETNELRRCEAVIESGLQTFVEVGTALLKIRDERLYRSSNATFEGYCRDRWSLARNRAYQLIDAAQVVANVQNFGHEPPRIESHTVPLAPLPAPQQVQAWTRAVETAPNGKPTARHVELAVAEVTGRAPAPSRAAVIEAPRQAAPTNGHTLPLGSFSRPIPTPLFRQEEEPEPEPESEADRQREEAESSWNWFFRPLNLFFVSLPRRGGILGLARNWSSKQRESAIAHLEELHDLSGRCLAELKGSEE